MASVAGCRPVSPSACELEPLSAADATSWDVLIAPYAMRSVFHRQAWLDYLAASRGVEIRRWVIRRHGTTVGYFCGGLLKKGPFRILGSPLKGWGTNVMGPVAHDDLDAGEFLEALEGLARQERWAMTELESPLIPPAALLDRGYEFTAAATFRVALSRDPSEMWRRLHGTRRTGVRKAEKHGLVVEDTDDPSIADEFYDQYISVMARKGAAPSFPRRDARLLFEYLRKPDLLFALRARDTAGRVVATGLFPHDDRQMYFWGGASRSDALSSCPNDLLHWTAMRLAGERGLLVYDTSGNGRFKERFGGVPVVVRRWHRSQWRVARWARRAYELAWRGRQRVLWVWPRGGSCAGGERVSPSLPEGRAE